MSALGVFSDDQKQAVVSLPFKVGMWVSHAEDIDGEADDVREKQAIERTVAEIAKLHEGSALLQEVAHAILESRDQWAAWEDQCFHVLKQAPGVVADVKKTLGVAEAKQYRAMVMEIAMTVARAHGEFAAFDDEEKAVPGFWGSVVGKIVSGFSGMSQDDKDHPMNVSPAEDSAISQLSAALKVGE